MNQIRSYEKYAVNIAVFGLDYLVKFRFKIRQLSHGIKVCDCKSCNFTYATFLIFLSFILYFLSIFYKKYKIKLRNIKKKFFEAELTFL